MDTAEMPQGHVTNVRLAYFIAVHKHAEQVAGLLDAILDNHMKPSGHRKVGTALAELIEAAERSD